MTRLLLVVVLGWCAAVCQAADYVEIYTSATCVPCVRTKSVFAPALRRRGLVVNIIDIAVEPVRAAAAGVGRVPTIILRDVRHKERRRWVGTPQLEDVVQLAVITETIVQPKASAPVVVVPPPVVVVQSKSYLYRGTYYSGRMCSNPKCKMCNEIEAGLAVPIVAPQAAPVVVPPTNPTPPPPVVPADTQAAQEPTPTAMVGEMLDLLALGPDDIFMDIGCGDGRILIAAAARCRLAVGVEIDPAVADTARKNVSDSGMAGKVIIITGDARSVDMKAWGTTVATAYLYPEMLAELAPKLKEISRVASPFHAVDGLPMAQIGDVWVYRR